MQKLQHYNLDEVEQGVRLLFKKVREHRLPSDPRYRAMAEWQRRTEDVRAAFARYHYSMVNEAIDVRDAAHIVGVCLGDLASDFISNVDNGGDVDFSIELANAIMQGMLPQLEAGIAAAMGDRSKITVSTHVDPVVSGQA